MSIPLRPLDVGVALNNTLVASLVPVQDQPGAVVKQEKGPGYKESDRLLSDQKKVIATAQASMRRDGEIDRIGRRYQILMNARQDYMNTLKLEIERETLAFRCQYRAERIEKILSKGSILDFLKMVRAGDPVTKRYLFRYFTYNAIYKTIFGKMAGSEYVEMTAEQIKEYNQCVLSGENLEKFIAISFGILRVLISKGMLDFENSEGTVDSEKLLKVFQFFRRLTADKEGELEKAIQSLSKEIQEGIPLLVLKPSCKLEGEHKERAEKEAPVVSKLSRRAIKNIIRAKIKRKQEIRSKIKENEAAKTNKIFPLPSIYLNGVHSNGNGTAKSQPKTYASILKDGKKQ